MVVVVTARWEEAVVVVASGPRETKAGATAPGRDGAPKIEREEEDIVDNGNGGDVVERVACTFDVWCLEK